MRAYPWALDQTSARQAEATPTKKYPRRVLLSTLLTLGAASSFGTSCARTLGRLTRQVCAKRCASIRIPRQCSLLGPEVPGWYVVRVWRVERKASEEKKGHEEAGEVEKGGAECSKRGRRVKKRITNMSSCPRFNFLALVVVISVVTP